MGRQGACYSNGSRKFLKPGWRLEGQDWTNTDPPVVIQVKANAMPARIRQYPMPRDTKQVIALYIRCLRDLGIFITASQLRIHS